MRTYLSAVVLLAGMTMSVAAEPFLPPALRIPMPAPAAPAVPPRAEIWHRIELPPSLLYRSPRIAPDNSFLIANAHTRYEDEPHPVPSLHIGAFHLELGGDATKTHFAHYSLDGVRILGGGISGSIDSRSARIAIRWPTGS